ncbi:unnamed protein product [Arctia plantaginis]|uniref:Uncharacterized protein n=1 Tax=Arctia plantaginis TaxID=874455 RepID=A0A8S1BC88_ARCPL|nr:unnamed protein product [Arctia plantaginis]
MEPSRLPRQILLREIAYVKISGNPPKVRLKDSVKSEMISFNINFSDPEDLAEEHNQWRRLITDGLETHDEVEDAGS